MNQAVYKSLFQALATHFEDDVKTRGMDETTLLEVVRKSLGQDDLKAHKDEIRQAIIHFYSTKGFKAHVFFKNDTILIKSRLYDLENNVFVSVLSREFSDVYKHATISKDVEGISFIPEKTTRELLEFLHDVEEVDHKKEIIKNGLKKIMDLHSRDALFFVGNKIMIKRFKKSSEPKPAAKEANVQAKRSFDHIPQEALEYTDQKMREEGLEEKIEVAIGELSKEKLNFSKIDNFYFGKNFIKHVQEKFLVFLKDFMKNESPDNVMAFANFLLRKEFDNVLRLFAIRLIELLLIKDSYAEKFVKFYNGDTAFSTDGKRFQKPDIIDDKGQRWNASTIFQVAMQRKKGLEKIKEAKIDMLKTQKNIQSLEHQITKSEKEILNYQKHLEVIQKEFQEMSEKTQSGKDRIFELKKVLQKESDASKKQKMQEEINQLSIDIKRLHREEETNLKEKKKAEAESEKMGIKLNILKKDLLAFQKKLKNDFAREQNLETNQKPLNEKYDTTVRALAKALSSFRGA